MSSAPARQQQEPMTEQLVLRQLLDRYRPIVERLLAPTGISEATFRAQIANAVRGNPQLLACDPETTLGAALRCAQVGLAPNDGNNLAWIIPYARRATFQLGYGGVMELARRAVPGLLFDGHAVYPGDEFSIDLGAEQPLVYRPGFARLDASGRRMSRRSREAFAWWVRARYPDGRVHVHALDRSDVEYHRSFSKQPNGEMWSKSYDAAALKSVVLDMRRWLPASPQLAQAASADGSIVDVRDLDPDADALPPADSAGELEEATAGAQA